MLLRPLLLLVLTFAVSAPSFAQSPDLERMHFTIGEHTLVTLPGRAEVVGGYAGSMVVDVADPAISGVLSEELSVFSRLRLAPGVLFMGSNWPVFTTYTLSADLDVRYEIGEMSGDALLRLDPVRAQRSEVPLPRLLEARAAAVGDHLAISFGLTRSSWGLGMLANDGRPRSVISGASPFGYSRTMDRVVRAQVAVFPFGRTLGPADRSESTEPPLTIALAGDAVIEDDNADWLEGDRTWHAVGAVRGRIAGFLGGVYGVHRRQAHAAGGDTAVTLIDLYVRQEMSASDVRIWGELEGAISFGETTFAENPLSPGPQTILAGGGLARVGVQSGLFGLVLEAGYASGDDNTYDNEQRAFTFDREHRVGLLMFRESLRKATAVSAANIEDPTYRASPPRGYERTATSGAVRGAIYVNPRVTVEVVEGLTAMVGYLHARSDGVYTDPFQSGLVGGASAGLRGTLFAENFGDEINLGLDYALDLDSLGLRFRGEFAWFSPGDIFESPSSDEPARDQVGGWLHGEVSW
ncbi:MAG: hypothetical protein ACPGU1_02510 [Myxococcota bacterium]